MRRLTQYLLLATVISGTFFTGCVGNDHDKNLAKAVQLLKSGQNEKARSALEKLEKDAPHNETLLYYLAKSYEATGSDEKAEKTLLKAVSGSVNTPIAHVALASLYRKKKDYTKAIKHSKLASNLDLQNTVYLNDLGVSYSVAGNTKLALAAYDKVLQIEPDNVTTLYNTGKLYLREKLFQRAEDSFEKAQKIQTTNCKIMFLLAEAKFALGKLSEARKIYNIIIAINPPELSSDFGRINYQLGRGYLEERSYESANSCFKRAKKLGYAKDRTNFYLGQTAFEIEEYDKALKLLRTIGQDKWQEIPEVSYYLGLCLFEKEQYNEAIENLQESLMSGLPKAPVLTRMGLAYLHIQNNLAGMKKEKTSAVLLAKAKKLFKRALEDDPDNIKAMMGVGRVLYKEKNPEETLNIMERITEISGGYSRSDLLSSLCQYDMSNRPKAILYGRKYIARHPEDTKVLMYLAQIEMETGKSKEAEVLLRKAITLDKSNWNAMILLSSVCSEQGRYIEAAEILLNVLNDSKDRLILDRAQRLYDYITKPYKKLLFPERSQIEDSFPPGSMKYIQKKLAPAFAFRTEMERKSATKEENAVTGEKLLKLTRELVVDYKDLRDKQLFPDSGDKSYYKKEIRKLIVFVREFK